VRFGFLYKFVRNISHSKKNSARYSYKVVISSTRYSCQILKELEIHGGFSKNPQISSLIKIRRLGTELFYTDGRTDRQTYEEATSSLHNLANAPLIITTDMKKLPVLFTI
jgi:hypothetical protein